MITKIHLKNFKCFREEIEFDFENKAMVTICGDNSTGKTTVLDSILLLLKKLTKDEDTKLGQYVHKGSDEDSNVAFAKYQFDVDGNKLEYGIEFSEQGFIWEYAYVNENKLLERNEEKAILYLEKPIAFQVEDKDVLFLKKLYLNTRFEGIGILKKWFDFIKRFMWLDAFSGEICMCNGKKTLDDIFGEEYSVNGDIPFEMESRSNQIYEKIMPVMEKMTEKNSIMLVDDLNRVFAYKKQKEMLSFILEKNKATQFFLVSFYASSEIKHITCMDAIDK